MPAPVVLHPFALVEVMDQLDPVLRQRLVRDIFVVGAQSFVDQSQLCSCVLHGFLKDVQGLIGEPRDGSTVPYRINAALGTCLR